MCLPRGCGCVPTKEVSLHATEEVWLCARLRGVAVCTLKRCGCVPTEGCGCVPSKEVGLSTRVVRG